MRSMRQLALIGLLLSTLIGCTRGGQDIPAAPPTIAAPPTTPAAPETAPLLEALSLLPTSYTNIRFTDWVAIKRFAGDPEMTSASPELKQYTFLTALTNKV